MDVLTRGQMLSPTASSFVLTEGLTIDAMLDATQWDRALLDFTVVTVDGAVVPRELWTKAKPRPGRKVLIGLRPDGGGGGDTGKQILQAVAMIAIVVIAAYIAGPAGAGAAVGSFLGIGTAAGTALVVGTITAVGSLALSALIRPPSLSRALTANTSLGNAPEESRLYGIGGAQNSARLYGVVPRIYGRHRVTAPLAAETYVMSAGPSQTVYVLLDFGYGPLQIDDLCIGNTSIGNFPGVQWRIHPYYQAGDPLEFYKNDQASLEVNSVLSESVDVIRVVPQAGSVINIDFGFPGGLVEFSDRGLAQFRQEIVDVYIAPSSNPTAWAPLLAYPAYAIYQGEGGVTTAGERQLGVPPGYWRDSGATGPGFITGFGSMEKPQLGDRFVYIGVEYTITGVYSPPRDGPGGEDPSHTEIGLDRVPGNLHWNGVFGEDRENPGAQPMVFRPAGSSGAGPLTVTLGVHSPAQVVFRGASRVPRTVSVAVQMPYEDDWNVMVRRMTPVSNSSLVSNGILWTILRSGRWVSPILPKEPRCIVEIQVTASEQLSGQIENINALVTSYLWDWRVGAMQASRNPALAYADVLTGTANPRRVPWSQIDQSRIGDWANRCDALSATGDTKATCDMVVDFRTTVGELCQSIAAVGRAAPSVRDGLYSVLVEEADPAPVQMFTNRNTRSMTAVRSWIDIPHGIKVRFISENSWEREETIVYDDGYDQNNATKFETLDLIGVVRPPQAWREGRYYLAAARLRRERMTVETDIENIVCARGDLVRIAHEHLLGNAVGRVRKIEGGKLTLDANLEGQGWGSPLPLPPPTSSFYLDSATGTPAGMTFTRASTATHIGPGGALVEVAANVLRYQRDTSGVQQGALLEEASTNIVRNPRCAGAVPLSTLPTNWTASGVSGWSHQVIGSGVEDGISYVDIRIWSAASNGNINNYRINLEPIVTMLAGETWTGSVYHRVVGGSLGGFVSRLFVGLTASSGFFTIPQPTTGPLRLQRVISTRPFTVNETTNGFSYALFTPGPNGAGAGDVTIRLGFPQCEKQPYVTSVILPPVGAPAVATRARDDLLVNGSAITDMTHGSIAIRYLTERGGSASAVLPGTSNALYFGTSTDQVKLRQPSNSLPRPTWEITSAGVLVASFQTSVQTNGAFLSSAVSWGGGQAGAAFEGVFHSGDTSAPSPGPVLPTTLGLNRGATAASGVGQILRTLHIWNGIQLDHEQLAIASAPSFYPILPSADLYAQFRTPEGVVLDPVPVVWWQDYDQIVVDVATAVQLAPGDIVSVGTLGHTTSDWLVDVVRPGADFSASVELIEHAPGVMDADTGPIPPYVPASGDGWLTTLDPVRDLILVSAPYSYDASGIPTIRNQVSWVQPNYPVARYMVERILTPRADGPYAGVKQLVGETSNSPYTEEVDARVLVPEGTTVTYFVTPIASTTGRRGAEASVSGVLYRETTMPPEVVFTSNVLSETTMLIWETPTIPDLDYYQLRFTHKIDAAARDWNEMTVMVEELSKNLTTLTVHAQTGLYAIRARDTSGNWGPPSYTLTTIGTLPHINNVTTLAGKPWSGRHEGTVILSDELRMATLVDGTYPSEAWFFPTAAVAYPAPWLFRLRGRIDAYGLRDGAPLGEDMRDLWDVRIFVSVQKTAPKLNSSWFQPLSHAVPLAGGPSTFFPLGQLASTDVEGRQINWALRLTSKQPDVTPVVRDAWLVVDHSERREFDDDVPTGTGGKLITFASPFFAAPTVAITLNNGQAGDRIVKSTNTTSFTVEIFNGTTSVDRKIDWIAQGYGRGIAP